jgi:hypothetical protein
MYDVVSIFLIWFLCLLSVLLHELGHALGYWISRGKTEWKICAGSGPEILSTAKYSFCLLPVGGYFNPSEGPGTRKAKIVTFTGGPVVSLLMTVLYCACCFCFVRFMDPENTLYELLFPVSRFLVFFNFFQFLFTILPIRYRVVCRGLESDGLQIVHALKHEKA